MANKEKTPKKKKSLFRRILKWTGITFFVLIILIILIPILFKDQIKQLVLDEVNKTLKADVAIGDFDLTFLSTFPNVTIQLYDTKVTGRTEFKGVELANIKTIEAHVGLWDVIGGDQIEIDEVHISDAKFDVRVAPDGKANYDIVIPTEELPKDQQDEPSAFKMSLQEYSLNNIQLVYDDQAGDMYAAIKNLNHTGSGDLTADVIDFETTTKMDELTYEMDGMTYLSKVKSDFVVNLLMEFKEKSSKFTLKENTFALNNFKTSLDGFYAMNDGYDNMDLKMNTKEISFKDLLSLVPSFYQSGYESMIAKGDLKMNGMVKGRMDEKNLPGWDFGLNVKNASIKYPDLPGSINNIIVDAGSKFPGGSELDKLTLDVTKFHSDFVGNVLDATLKLRNPMTDPLINSKIMAKVNLATLGKVMPLAEGESYKGKLNADVNLNGRMSAIEQERYQDFNAKGLIELFDLLYKSPDLNETVEINKMALRFSPQNMALEQMDAKMGKSDFNMNGTIDNYLGYVFGTSDKDNLLKGNFNFNSTNMDLDQLMGVVPASEPTATASAEPAPVDPNAEPLLIPDNIDFNLNTNIQKMRYNGIDVNNINGNVKMKEEVASLNNLTMNTMGGKVGLRGSYSSQDHNKPAIDFGYNLADIDIQQISSKFLTIQKLAPIAKYAKGKFSSNLNLKSTLTKSLEPIYNSLTGDGDFFTNLVTVTGFEPMKKLGESMNINKLENQTFKDVKAFFSFADGKVTTKKPIKVNMSGIETEVSGSTAFNQDIDYKMKMMVPKSMIPASMIKQAEQALAKVNSLSPKLNVGSIPEKIPVSALVGGTVTKPVIKTDFKEALLKATGNLTENLKAQGQELVNKAKDSVKTIVKDKVNEVREDLNKKKEEIMDQARKEAEKVKAEAKKAADQVRAEADKQCEAGMKEAGSNPLKKKAAELACKEAKKKAESTATKIEQEGQTKADAIMAKAQEKADAVK